MTVYGRTYTPPVFHTEEASNEQLKVMQIVFVTLQNSGIDFSVVKRDEKNSDTLCINSFGSFSIDEKKEILEEVAEMYFGNEAINHISME